ncbi:MAG: hypothetical protein LBK41_09780 [Clostridiales bacterium]|nr:hypothetical protein [Clostridiales bacterium]
MSRKFLPAKAVAFALALVMAFAPLLVQASVPAERDYWRVAAGIKASYDAREEYYAESNYDEIDVQRLLHYVDSILPRQTTLRMNARLWQDGLREATYTCVFTAPLDARWSEVDGALFSAARDIERAARTQRDKIRLAHDWIANNCRYAREPFVENHYSASGIVLLGEAVCSGYADAFKIIMDHLGIPCVSVLGRANGGDHQWNIVYADGQWLHVDVTFDDPVTNYGDDIIYDYYLVGDADIFKDHACYPLTWKEQLDFANYYYTDQIAGLTKPAPTPTPTLTPVATVPTLEPLRCVPTSQRVLVNGAPIAFDAYNINDSNYFKLIDIAYVLRGTSAEFDVYWDESKSTIILTSDFAYAPSGGELAPGSGQPAQPERSSQRISLNGEHVYPTAYLIGGRNYFKLTELADLIGFEVTWDEAARTVRVTA